MKKRALILSALALTAAACGDDAPATPAACEDVPFTANSDDMAADIRATGISCDAAVDFIRASDGAPPEGFRGYACTSKRIDDTLVHTEWRCTKGDATVTWSRF